MTRNFVTKRNLSVKYNFFLIYRDFYASQFESKISKVKIPLISKRFYAGIIQILS